MFTFPGAPLGLEVLQLTWFFSALYLLFLYMALFLKPSQGGVKKTALSSSIKKNHPAEFQTGLPLKTSPNFLIVTVIVLLALSSPFNTFFISYTDVAWASSALVGPFSYF